MTIASSPSTRPKRILILMDLELYVIGRVKSTVNCISAFCSGSNSVFISDDSNVLINDAAHTILCNEVDEDCDGLIDDDGGWKLILASD